LGDRVRVVANREDLAAISRYFGDSIRGTAEMNFTALGLGLAVGVFVGTIPIPIAGFGDFRLGLAGGPLLTALVLGSIQRTGPISWVLPASANLTVRQFGLMLFLATVGLSSGPGFAGTVKANGIVLVALGAVVTLGVALSSLVVGYKVLRIPFDELLGVVSGIHTESAAVAFASNMTQTDRPETGYASVYPVALILKVMVAQIIAGVETY
jgi:putative transport protein